VTATARAAASAAFGLEIATLAYAVLRLVSFVLYREPNPALVLYSLHAGYFWRAWTASYAGALAAFAFALLARHRPRAAFSALEGLLPWAALALVLQAVAVP
jgi:hypothetical protein